MKGIRWRQKCRFATVSLVTLMVVSNPPPPPQLEWEFSLCSLEFRLFLQQSLGSQNEKVNFYHSLLCYFITLLSNK